MARPGSGHGSHDAARKVERVADKVGSKVDAAAAKLSRKAAQLDAASAELARKAARLDELSASIVTADLWTRPEPGARRTRFTRDELAAAAVRIADTEGFEALSMRRLAIELDAGTMTLYHYVRNKDELLALVADEVMGELVVPPGELPVDDWRAAITMIAHRSLDVMRRHPWVLEIRDDPTPGPNAARHFDQTMQAVMTLDISLGDRFEITTMIDEYVFGFSFVERSNYGHEEAQSPDLTEYFTGLVATGEYPALAAIEAEFGVMGGFDMLSSQARDPQRFARNLKRLLDGIAADLDLP